MREKETKDSITFEERDTRIDYTIYSTYRFIFTFLSVHVQNTIDLWISLITVIYFWSNFDVDSTKLWLVMENEYVDAQRS